MRAALAVACVLLGVLAAVAPAQDSSYCDPAATALDPSDVPPEGSAPIPVNGVEESRITISGVGTRVLQAGRPHARTAVVFLHGSPGSASDWAELLPQVAGRRHRAVAFDIPGFGHAEAVWGIDPSLEPAVAGLESALAALGIRRVHLVVHDIGGPLGMEWGARHPKRLRSATLINTGLLINYRHHSLAQLTRTPGAGDAFWAGLNRESFAAGIQNGQTRPLPPEFVNRLYDDLDRETRCTILALYRGTDEPEIHEFSQRQAEALQRRRRRPALVIWGANDPYLPPSMAADQKQGFPRARIHVLDGAGHWPFVDYAAETRALMVPFIKRALTRQ